MCEKAAPKSITDVIALAHPKRKNFADVDYFSDENDDAMPKKLLTDYNNDSKSMSKALKDSAPTFSSNASKIIMSTLSPK